MSKFLKFIVNICLLAAILTAVAILVPPLIGITTTIVDTPSMNTNLPLGSVTYSTEVDVSEIKVGDEILKETSNSSTYAYIVHEADPDAGVFKVVSAMDRNGSEEEIYLRNKVPKVAVMVPLIGYVLIAMHTLEGRIIVGLVVALLIILFILSELWRPVADEDYIDEDLPEEEAEEEKSSVTAHEETGIDTEAIKAAVEENQSLVESENAATPASSPETEGGTAEVSAEVDQMIAEARSSARGEMREIKADEMEDAFSAEIPAGESADTSEKESAEEDIADRTVEISGAGKAGSEEAAAQVENLSQKAEAEGYEAASQEKAESGDTASAKESEKPKSRGFLAGVAAAFRGNKGGASASERETEDTAEYAGDSTSAEESVRTAAADDSVKAGPAGTDAAGGAVKAAAAGAAAAGAAAAEYTVRADEADAAEEYSVQTAAGNGAADYASASAAEEAAGSSAVSAAKAEDAPEKFPYNNEETLSDMTPAVSEGSAFAGDGAEEKETLSESGSQEEADEAISFDPSVLGEDAAEIPEEPDDLKRGEILESEGIEQDAADEGPVLSDITNEGTLLPGGRFIPTPRPTLDEILESAKNAGAEPRLIKDEATGITVADFSKLL